MLLASVVVPSCSPENFAQSQAAQKAWYNSKAGALFNAMVPGKNHRKDGICCEQLMFCTIPISDRSSIW